MSNQPCPAGTRAYAGLMSAQPHHVHGPVPRDPKAIRAALADEYVGQFDAAYASALEQARALSLVELNAVLDQWWMFVNLFDGHARMVEYGTKILAGEPVPVADFTLEDLRA